MADQSVKVFVIDLCGLGRYSYRLTPGSEFLSVQLSERGFV